MAKKQEICYCCPVLQVKFLEKKEIAQNTWQFMFEKPSGFAFVAGQFTTLYIGDDNRDFTICAESYNKKTFSIVTKSGISEFKKKLFFLKNNTKILMNKPSGGFLYNKNKTPKVFLAGGVGITVFYSIICSNKNIKTPITLLASFSKKENIIFQKELEEIQKKNENIKVIYSLSRISQDLIQKHIPNFLQAEYMIAGGEQMVYDMEDLLQKMKISQDNIRIDIFTGYK